MGRNRARSSAKIKRKENAIEAQQHLSKIMTDVSMPMIARINAAKHLVKTSKRNRLPLPVNQRHWVCRECTQLLIPGENSRVRIRNGQRIITCLSCGNVRRIGGGPNYHRSGRDV